MNDYKTRTKKLQNNKLNLHLYRLECMIYFCVYTIISGVGRVYIRSSSTQLCLLY
jgi:hypothetical protein